MHELPAELEHMVARVSSMDPALGREVGDVLARVLGAASSLAWARDQVPVLAAAQGEAALLQAVVDLAVGLTGAPEAWALTWAGSDVVRFKALASSGGAPRTAEGVVTPGGLSRSVLAQVAREGRPAWSDDAVADARFLAAESVQALSLCSVGCLPLGPHGALYLHDPSTPGRFSLADRGRLAALCALASQMLPEVRRPAPRAPEPLPGLVGDTPAMAELARAVRAFAPMPWPVLILGETGTGKEAVARAVHGLSGVVGEFVAVNCGAIPEELAESTLFGHVRGAFTGADRAQAGLVARARGGTLFLDEVGELSPRVQVKLLRLLQEGTFTRLGDGVERRFEGRVLAATHRDVRTSEGFRDDLYHRLSACVVTVPPLRDRREDVPALAEVLLTRAKGQVPGASALGIEAAALRALAARPWPGNVRELENVLRGALALALAGGATHIGVGHLSASPRGASSQPAVEAALDLLTATQRFQQVRVREALERHHHNKTATAAALGVSRQWLHRLLARWDREGPW